MMTRHAAPERSLPAAKTASLAHAGRPATRAPQPVGSAAAAPAMLHDFSRMRVLPEDGGAFARTDRPRLSVRSVTPVRAAARDGAPDKSTIPRAGDQDQRASLTTFAPTANGVQIVVEAEGAYSSEEFPDSFKWTQTIETDVPLNGATSPYVDPHTTDDAKPFYYTDAEQAAFLTTFHDAPSRVPPVTGSIFWQATLSLDGVNEATKTATSFDCITYGFALDSAGTVTPRAPASTSAANHQSILASEFPAWTFN